MKISIITLFPTMVASFFEESIVKRAQEKKLVEIELVNLRDFAIDDYGTVDDRPYGGGVGMIMRVDVIHRALSKISKHQSPNTNHQKTVLTSPKGKTFNQHKATEYAPLSHLILIAGHYEGVDERVMDFVDEEVSLGDFVMTGGELTAAAITDAVVRLIPGVLKKDGATEEESFFTVSIDELIQAVGVREVLRHLQSKGVKKITLLEYPHYTRPETFQGKKVPEILLSGDPKKIKAWHLQQAFEETLTKRPDLLRI